MPLSPKQILSIAQANHRYNIWVGAVSSGKTYASILKLIDLLRNGPPGDVMIIGVNRETIQRNVLTHLYLTLGFNPPASKSTEAKLYNRNVYFVGAHDESSVRRIQGSTLAIAYIDEMACIPYPFIKMLQSRLRVPKAQLLATCNPEGPAHWLKKEFLDQTATLDLISWNFGLEDNPGLAAEYVENIKKEYTGMWYKRLILGQWVASVGAIFDAFDDDNLFNEDFDAPNYYIAGIDYGTVNPTCCLLAAISPRRWPQICIVDEYYFDSAKFGRSKTDGELADDIKKFLANYPVRMVYIDPAATSLKVELRNQDVPVAEAKNDVIPGIQVVAKFMAGKNLMVHRKCKNLIDEIYTYQWDPKAAARGVDKPIKEKDHAVDSLKYLCYSAFPTGQFHHIDDDLTIEQLRRKIYGDRAMDMMGNIPQGGYL